MTKLPCTVTCKRDTSRRWQRKSMRAGIMRIYNSTHASRYRELVCAISSNLDDKGVSMASRHPWHFYPSEKYPIVLKINIWSCKRQFQLVLCPCSVYFVARAGQIYLIGIAMVSEDCPSQWSRVNMLVPENWVIHKKYVGRGKKNRAGERNAFAHSIRYIFKIGPPYLRYYRESSTMPCRHRAQRSVYNWPIYVAAAMASRYVSRSRVC